MVPRGLPVRHTFPQRSLLFRLAACSEDDRRAELKLHPQGTLNNARSATYSACGRANCRGRGSAHSLGDFPEVPAALVPDRIGEISVVKQIKEVRAEA